MDATVYIDKARRELDEASGDVHGMTFLEHVVFHIGVALVYALLAITLAIKETKGD